MVFAVNSGRRTLSMKNTILFHSTPEELQGWLSRWTVQFPLHAVGCSFFPAQRVLVARNTASSPDDYSKFNEIILGLDADTLAEFCVDPKSSIYPAGFRIMPPEMTSDGLRSGSLDLIQKEPMNLDIWRALVADVRKHTTAGMWLYIKFNGRKVFNKDLRYTPGIVELTGQGVQLLPFAGGNPVTIDEPPSQQHDTTRTTP
jgi:hypothetical protein